MKALLMTAALLGSAASAQSFAAPAEGTLWTLESMTVSGETLTFPRAGVSAPTLRLDGREASGGAGCNTYRGLYAGRENVLRFGKLATTRLACPDAAMRVENLYLGALRRVTGVASGGGTLTLLAGAGDQLVFRAGAAGTVAAGGVRPAPTAPTLADLAGSWRVERGGAWLVPANAPTLSFAGDQMSGSGGCNRLMGRVSLSGGLLVFGPLASTRMACAPALNAQETAFLRFLGSGPLRLDLAGGTLTLRAGGQTLELRRTAPPSRR